MDKFTSKFKKHFGGDSHTSESRHNGPPVPKNLILVRDHDSGQDAVDAGAPAARDINIQNVVELGNVSSMSTLVKRDLGFQGKLGHYILLTYGDTMFTDSHGSDEFRGMTCNSSAIACDDATQVFDALLDDHGYPHCLLKPSEEYGEDPSKYALGITNVVETSHDRGKSVGTNLLLDIDNREASCTSS